jgi:hypothetical protein
VQAIGRNGLVCFGAGRAGQCAVADVGAAVARVVAGGGVVVAVDAGGVAVAVTVVVGPVVVVVPPLPPEQPAISATAASAASAARGPGPGEYVGCRRPARLRGLTMPMGR